MQLKGLAITMGLGAAAGAVAILMMPKNNPTRKLVAKAAEKADEIINNYDPFDIDEEIKKIFTVTAVS